MLGRQIGLAALTAALMAGAVTVPASAQEPKTLTMFVQELTAFVENYNPYNTTTRLPSVEDFMFEPLIIFNVLQGGEPNFRLAESYQYSDDLKSADVQDPCRTSNGRMARHSPPTT